MAASAQPVRGAALTLSALGAVASFALCALFLAGGVPGDAGCAEAAEDAFSCTGPGFGFAALCTLSVPVLVVLAWRRHASSTGLAFAAAAGVNALLQAVLVTVMTPHA